MTIKRILLLAVAAGSFSFLLSGCEEDPAAGADPLAGKCTPACQSGQVCRETARTQSIPPSIQYGCVTQETMPAK